MRKISNPELCPSMHQRDHFCTLQKWSRAVDEVIGYTAHGANARRMRSHEVAWFGAETRRNGKNTEQTSIFRPYINLITVSFARLILHAYPSELTCSRRESSEVFKDDDVDDSGMKGGSTSPARDDLLKAYYSELISQAQAASFVSQVA